MNPSFVIAGNDVLRLLMLCFLGGAAVSSVRAQVLQTLWTQLPSHEGGGGGRPSSFDWGTLTQGTNFAPPNAVVAEDFRADGLPVLRVRWWGTYQSGTSELRTNITWNRLVSQSPIVTPLTPRQFFRMVPLAP